jgi:Putative zinc-finger
MTWHVERSMLARYVSGDLGEVSVLSIEAHLLSCAECRGALPPLIDPARLDRMWTGVRDVVHAPRRGRAERLLVGLGVRDHVARLLVVTPSLQLSWLASMALSLVFAVMASHWFGGGNLPFLVVAPVVPVVGVAWSFSRPRDPVWEIGRATATGGLRLTLIRTVTVLATSVVVSGVVSLGLPRAGWAAAAWLLPALALTVLTLALSTTGVATEPAAGGVCAVWVVAVTMISLADADRLAAFGAVGQVALGVVLAVSTVVVMFRRDALDGPLRSQRTWG